MSEMIATRPDLKCHMCDDTGMALFVQDLTTLEIFGPYMCQGEASDAEIAMRKEVGDRAYQRFHICAGACPCKRQPYDYGNERMADKIRRALPPPRLLQFEGMTWETFEGVADSGKRNALETVHAYTEGTDVEFGGLVKTGLVLSGKCGVGKSGLLHLLYQEREGDRAVWIDYNALIAFIQSTYGNRGASDTQEIMRSMQSVKFLFIDDMGDVARAVSTTDDRRDKTYEIIRVRHERRLPTYITTNLDKTAFARQFGDRIAQRVFELCHWIPVGGAVLRK
jgi:DNA replication protein DnaC